MFLARGNKRGVIIHVGVFVNLSPLSLPINFTFSRLVSPPQFTLLPSAYRERKIRLHTLKQKLFVGNTKLYQILRTAPTAQSAWRILFPEESLGRLKINPYKKIK